MMREGTVASIAYLIIEYSIWRELLRRICDIWELIRVQLAIQLRRKLVAGYMRELISHFGSIAFLLFGLRSHRSAAVSSI